MLHLRVSYWEGEWWIDLPQLTSIRLGRNAFLFDWDDPNSGILYMKSRKAIIGSWIDLPRLAVFTAEGDESNSFTNLNIIDLEGSACQTLWRVDLPLLTTVVLTNSAFKCQKRVTVRSRSVWLPSFIDAGVLARYFNWFVSFTITFPIQSRRNMWIPASAEAKWTQLLCVEEDTELKNKHPTT